MRTGPFFLTLPDTYKTGPDMPFVIQITNKMISTKT